MTLDGRTVLVTGASRGIGRAIARQFATQGAHVALHYHRGREAAGQTLATLPGGLHHLVQADLSEAQGAAGLIQQVISAFGRLDVLVNNAAIAEPHPILEIDFPAWDSAWQRLLATNLYAPADLTFLAARIMVEQVGGRIINISSRGAFRGEPGMPAYAASKAALNAMSQSLAQALAPHRVYVYSVAPGWVATERVASRLSGASGEAILRESPMGRVATPDEVAHTVCFLASDGAESLTGAVIDVNGASYLR